MSQTERKRGRNGGREGKKEKWGEIEKERKRELINSDSNYAVQMKSAF